MAHLYSNDAIFKMMQNLQCIAKKYQEQNPRNSNRKYEQNRITTDPNIPPRLPRSFSDVSIFKNTGRTKSIQSPNQKFENSRHVESKKTATKRNSEKLNFKVRNLGYYSGRTSTMKNVKLNSPSRSLSETHKFFQPNGNSHESSDLRGLNLSPKRKTMLDCRISRSSSPINKNITEVKEKNPATLKKDRFVDLIDEAVKENFKLRESNVKLLRQLKLQYLKIRDLKYKLSLQSQILIKQKAEQKTVNHLENIIRCKQLEIQNLKYQIKVLKQQSTDMKDVLPKVEPRHPKMTSNQKKQVHREEKRQSTKIMDDHQNHRSGINIGSFASKLNYILLKLRENAESCSSQLKVLEGQKVEITDRFKTNAAVGKKEAGKTEKNLELEYSEERSASTDQAKQLTFSAKMSNSENKSDQVEI